MKKQQPMSEMSTTPPLSGVSSTPTNAESPHPLLDDLDVPRIPQQARSREKRDRLLSAALELFERRGYEGATIDGIAERAGGDAGLNFVLPFLMFIFLMALGEDYNILVMSRIREEAQRKPLGEAITVALGATGTTVTSAGLILAATFGVAGFAGASDQIHQLGIGIAVGVLLDTFLVRTLLVPSVVALLGRWNWWPSKLGRRSSTTAMMATKEQSSLSAPSSSVN